jgi:formylmethanofuran dehydrogenase subunit A
MGKLLHVAPAYDPGAETDIGQWFEECYSIRFRNYPVGDAYSHDAEQIACRT